ncbi:alpha/beta fold hydrolase [Streptomyces prunicolor]|uniref:Alpha/beta hydrolase n=1 Tax=Streptomyces prunicolor TaxID=67348 RepID=A0ABU4FBY0_9ACTN|nr:alpha/beta hydrolase [Streptomyces prunicolor]MCX5239179.1 alpha/beta hydrolase [Streptomyces prunicolor]MDV7218103.1 alpha/beta hydrolase [Streptomyces prunicolor]
MSTTPSTDPLATGTHTVEIDGVTQSYHVHGSGPVLVAHSGGPGIFWEYLRMPALEEHLTVVYPEPIGTGASGRLPAHPHGYTRARYSRFLAALIEHLGVPEVHLLGHSHGGFVAQYHALHHPDRIAGVILYDSAPVTGPEHGAEAMRLVQEFAARNADNPDLPEVIEAFQSIPTISDDAQMTAVARGIFPAYFADFWGRQDEFGPARAGVTATYISGLDDDLTPDVIDDRAALGSLTVPTLVLVGRHDVICGVRWAEELHELIPGSELVIFENSGHFGHLEEPEAFAKAVAAFVEAPAGN